MTAPGAACPGCAQPVYAAVAIQAAGQQPGPDLVDGALVLCGNCGDVGVLAVGPLGVTVRAADTDELAAWAAHPQARAVSAALLQLRARR